MGVHHAWGRTYKIFGHDFIIYLATNNDFRMVLIVRVWVEVEVEKELGLHSKKDIENLVPEIQKLRSQIRSAL